MKHKNCSLNYYAKLIDYEQKLIELFDDCLDEKTLDEICIQNFHTNYGYSDCRYWCKFCEDKFTIELESGYDIDEQMEYGFATFVNLVENKTSKYGLNDIEIQKLFDDFHKLFN